MLFIPRHRKAFKIICLSFLILLTCISSALEKRPDIQFILRNRNEVINVFRGKTIRRTPRELILSVPVGSDTVSFYFANLRKGILLENYHPILEDDLQTLKTRASVTRDMKAMMAMLDQLGIREITSEYKSAGIFLWLFLKQSGSIMYVPDINRVTNPNLRKSVLASKRLQDQWYFR